MTKEKKSIKKILSDQYDNEVVEKIEKLITIDAQDYEVAIDPKKSKNYYETYLSIFYGIITCKNEKDLGKWRDPIIENKPWEEALEDSKQFRSIADSDRSILEPLIEKEIKNFKNEILSEKLTKFYNVNNIVELLSKNSDEKEKLERIIDKDIATKFYEAIFSDFEHAFDGNFENPRVIILGINPRLKDIKHDSYELTKVYEKPFDSKRPTLYSEKNKRSKDKYYFIPNGFFFMKNKEHTTPNKIKEDFLLQITSIEKDTPYALWEFFPYATNSENEWFGEIAISEKKITKYMLLKNFLPSQIWLLCLLTFTIKKALFESERELYIFCTKKEKTFQKSFIKPYFEDLLEITPTSNVKVLLKKGDRNRNFNVNNITPYFKTPETVFRKNAFKKFYNVIWKI
jgi:hypothetical protein